MQIIQIVTDVRIIILSYYRMAGRKGYKQGDNEKKLMAFLKITKHDIKPIKEQIRKSGK